MKVYFIGIGGIGISALAQYYLAKGNEVYGSDLVSSEITDLLKKKGATVVTGPQKEENLPEGIELVIYSPAVCIENPERREGEKLGIKIQSYPEALGDLTREYFTIAVSGTHGKSTTTAMISLILEKAGLDPTVIVGTKLKEFGGSNFREGKSEYLVIEADEWNASFLNYTPKIIVLNNIEEEHLDFYRDLGHILETYKEYVGHLSEDGKIIVNNDDDNIKVVIGDLEKKIITTFSISDKEADSLKRILKVPGEHNVYNALAALRVAQSLGVTDDVSLDALSEYEGVWRRFEVKEGEVNGKKITVINDYGHHPTEVRVTLEAAREKYPDKKIYCVFQPHQCQRTYYLFSSFVNAFKNLPIDKAIITDIYDVVGREKIDVAKQVSSEKLVEVINSPDVTYLKEEDIKDYLERKLKGGEVLIIMGAGDIYKLADSFSTKVVDS